MIIFLSDDIFFLVEFDLCDDNGQLKNLNSLEHWTNAHESGILISKATYIVVIIERKCYKFLHSGKY